MLNTAVFFRCEQGKQIRRVESLLWLAAQRMIEVSRQGLGEHYYQARDAIEQVDLECLFRLVRPMAAQMVVVQKGNIFWRWIDAYGFYRDAVTDHWPLMTRERRSVLLMWAGEEAASICEPCVQEARYVASI